LSKLRDLNKKYNQLINRISEIIKPSSKISNLDFVITLFLAYLLSDQYELSSRSYTVSTSKIKLPDLKEIDSYYYHYLFSRYFLERIKRKTDSIEYVKKKYKLAIKHLINLNDHSTPINLLGTIAFKAIDNRDLDFMEIIIDEARKLAGRRRTLILAEILGQISLKLAKLGLFTISYKYLSQALNFFDRLGYQRDIIRFQSRYILKRIVNLETSSIYVELSQLQYEFQTLVELLRLSSLDSHNYSSKTRKIIFKLVLESLSRDYWSKRDYFLESLVETHHIYDDDDLENLSNLAKRFNDNILGTLVNIIKIINESHVNKDNLIKLIQLSYELYKAGKYKLASDILVSIILKNNYDNLDFEEIRAILEIIAFYLETQGLFEEIYYLFGEVARREISRLRINNAIYFLQSSGKYRSTSQLLRLKLLFEPVIRATIRIYGYIPEEVYNALDEEFKNSNYLLVGYLYSIIAEEFLNSGLIEKAVSFINKMLNYGIPSPYFLSIIEKLLLSGYYDYVFHLLHEVSYFEMGNDELIAEVIKLAFAKIEINIGEKILSEFADKIPREKLGKVLADLSIILLDNGLEVHSINYLMKAIELLNLSKGYLTILYTIARFAARCDKIASIIHLIEKLLEYIEKRVGDNQDEHPFSY